MNIDSGGRNRKGVLVKDDKDDSRRDETRRDETKKRPRPKKDISRIMLSFGEWWILNYRISKYTSMYVYIGMYMPVEFDETGTRLKITRSWIRISMKVQIAVQPSSSTYSYVQRCRKYRRFDRKVTPPKEK